MLMFLFAFVVSLISGLWDLKTTDIPDELPAVLMSVGILYWLFNAPLNYQPLIDSLTYGTLFLFAGWVMYKKGQWGGGDAFLLGAILYTVPHYSRGLFAIDYVTNVFIVGAVYIIIYSLGLGLMNRRIFSETKKDIRENWKLVATPIVGFLIFTLFTVLYMGIERTYPLFYLLFLITGGVVFWRYGVTVEEKLFKKQIRGSELKEGDVVLESKVWKGVGKDELKHLRERKYLVVKEGVRFGMVFPIAMLVTWVWGNLIWVLV
jgi:Flp pilus assembly protein protease CpaA